MFDIGGLELLTIGIVALIVVGPKDLPGMFAAVGRFTAKARAMGREFQRAMNQAADDSGIADVQKDIKGMTSKQALGLDKVEEAARDLESWDDFEDKPAQPASAKKPSSTAAKPAARSTKKPAGTKKTATQAKSPKPRAASKTASTKASSAPKKRATSTKPKASKT